MSALLHELVRLLPPSLALMGLSVLALALGSRRRRRPRPGGGREPASALRPPSCGDCPEEACGPHGSRPAAGGGATTPRPDPLPIHCEDP